MTCQQHSSNINFNHHPLSLLCPKNKVTNSKKYEKKKKYIHSISQNPSLTSGFKGSTLTNCKPNTAAPVLTNININSNTYSIYIVQSKIFSFPNQYACIIIISNNTAKNIQKQNPSHNINSQQLKTS